LTLADTTIIIVRNAMQIVLAADSKRHDPRDPSKALEVCKIIRTRSFVFAATGLVEEGATGLNVQSLALTVSQTSGKLVEKVRDFEERLTDALLKSFKHIQQNDPNVFNRLPQDFWSVNAIFVGIENVRPVLFERSFKVVWSAEQDIKIDIWRRDCPYGINCDRKEGFSAYGQTDAIRSFLANNPKFWKVGFVRGARKLVELEIADKPNEVGLPIDIIRVDKMGINWIERKPQCPETHE